MTARTQLVVTYHDHQTMYFQVGPELGWKVDNASRCIVVGKFPRTYIPLDTVRSFEIESYGGDSPESADEFDGPLQRLHSRMLSALADARTASEDSARDGRTADAAMYDTKADVYDWVLQRIDEEAGR